MTMKTKNSPRKRLAKIFMTYALVGSALFGTGYGLQRAVDHITGKTPTAAGQVMPPKGLPGR